MLRCAVAVCMGLSLLAADAEEPVPVRLAGEVVFVLRHAGDADDVQQRAAQVSARLSDLLMDHQDDEPPLVEVGDADGLTMLSVDGAMVVRVYPEDLGPEDAVGTPTEVRFGGADVEWSRALFPEPEVFDQEFGLQGVPTWINGHEEFITLYALGTPAEGASLAEHRGNRLT